MGGRSSSTQTQTTTITENTFTSADYSSGDGLRLNLQGADVSGAVNVTSTDHGAVRQSLELAGFSVMESLDFGRDALGGALDTVRLQNADHMANLRSAQQHSSDQIQRALAHAAESDRSETAQAFNQLARGGLFALAALVAVWIIWGRK